MTLTRIVGSVALLAAVGGCSRPVPSRGTGTAADPTANPGATAVAPGKATEPAAADGFAKSFLAAAHAGNAAPDQLTPAFKKLVAPPVFGSEEAVGYSETGVADWLAGLKGKLPSPTLGPPVGTGDAVGFVAAGPQTATLRVVKAAGAWKADWLLVTPSAVAAAPPAGEAAFTAAAFLQAVAAPADRLAASVMTPALRERLAPPFGSDKGGYNAGILAQKLAALRGTATGFKVAAADGDKVTAVTTGPGKPATVVLTVAGGKVADWKAD
jgi:hypothetical protein